MKTQHNNGYDPIKGTFRAEYEVTYGLSAKSSICRF